MERLPTLKLIIEKREHLFALVEYLMDSLEPKFLADRENPVTVLMEGEIDCGKSIIPDAATAHVFGHSVPSFHDGRDGDQYQMNEAGAMAVHFINLDLEYFSFGTYSGLPTPDENREKLRCFKSQPRNVGGLTFIHNGDLKGAHRKGLCDFSVWMETPEFEAPKLSPTLRRYFNAKGRDHEWARYIEIRIESARLIASPKFLASLGRLKASRQGYVLDEMDVPGIERQDVFRVTDDFFQPSGHD